MADSGERLLSGLRQFVGNRKTTTIGPAVVLSVEQDMTCTVQDMYGLELAGVRLKASIDNSPDFSAAIPKIGSTVIICNMNKDEEWFVILYSAIDRFEYRAGTVSFEISDKGYKIEKDGQNLKTTIDSLIDAINAITVAVPGSGTSGTPLNFASFDIVKSQLNQILT